MINRLYLWCIMLFLVVFGVVFTAVRLNKPSLEEERITENKVIIGKVNDDFIKLAEDTYKKNKKTEKSFSTIPVNIDIQPTYIINDVKVEFNENGRIDFGAAAKIFLIDIGNDEKRIYKIETPNDKFKFKTKDGKEYEYSISQEHEVEREKDDIENKELFGNHKKQ